MRHGNSEFFESKWLHRNLRLGPLWHIRPSLRTGRTRAHSKVRRSSGRVYQMEDGVGWQVKQVQNNA